MRPDETHVREDVRHDVVLSRVVRVARRDPQRPGFREEADQLGVVDGEERVVRVRLRLDHGRAGPVQGFADRLGAFRHLVGGVRQADPHLATWLVRPMCVAPHDGHLQRHGGEPTSLRRG